MENKLSDYYIDYEVVYCVKYCTGEVGSLIWHTKNIFKSEEKANKEKEILLEKVRDLNIDYYSRFGKTCIKHSSDNEKNRYMVNNPEVRIKNVVVVPYRLEDTKKSNMDDLSRVNTENSLMKKVKEVLHQVDRTENIKKRVKESISFPTEEMKHNKKILVVNTNFITSDLKDLNTEELKEHLETTFGYTVFLIDGSRYSTHNSDNSNPVYFIK